LIDVNKFVTSENRTRNRSEIARVHGPYMRGFDVLGNLKTF
jgi:hypothetical protein